MAGFDLSDEKGREYLAVAQDPNAEDAERARAVFRLHMFPRFWDEVLAEAAKPNQPGWVTKALGMEAFSILSKCGIADDEHFDQLDPHVAVEARLMANQPRRPPSGFIG